MTLTFGKWLQQTDFNVCCCLGSLPLQVSDMKARTGVGKLSSYYRVAVLSSHFWWQKYPALVILWAGGEVEMLNCIYLASLFVYPCTDQINHLLTRDLHIGFLSFRCESLEKLFYFSSSMNVFNGMSLVCAVVFYVCIKATL